MNVTFNTKFMLKEFFVDEIIQNESVLNARCSENRGAQVSFLSTDNC